jgi:hypothetical protein
MLAGRKLVFVGDSQTRRHMWAIVDAVNAFFATQTWVEIDNRDEVC